MTLVAGQDIPLVHKNYACDILLQSTTAMRYGQDAMLHGRTETDIRRKKDRWADGRMDSQQITQQINEIEQVHSNLSKSLHKLTVNRTLWVSLKRGFKYHA